MAPADMKTGRAPFAPSRVLRVYGMRRSGNHALIDWIMRNAPDGGSGLFLNNCRPGRDPLRSARGKTLYARGAGAAVPGRVRDLAGPAPFVLVSYEDRAPDPAAAPLWDAPERTVIVYRSFLNWSASLLRKIQNNAGYGALDRARVMAGALPTYARLLEAVRQGATALCYDDWMAGEAYRAAALGTLDLPGRDLCRGAVQAYGGGSSFQGTPATAAALQTERRAAQMADDPEYRLLLLGAARDHDFMHTLAEVFPDDAARLSHMLETAQVDIRLPPSKA